MDLCRIQHSKNVASDAWRINQLERHLADPNHDFHKFGTGNLSTLDDVPKSQGINIRYSIVRRPAKHNDLIFTPRGESQI